MRKFAIGQKVVIRGATEQTELNGIVTRITELPCWPTPKHYRTAIADGLYVRQDLIHPMPDLDEPAFREFMDNVLDPMTMKVKV